MVCEGGVAVNDAIVLQGIVMVLEWSAMEVEVLMVGGLFIGSEGCVDACEEGGEGVSGFEGNLEGVGGMVAVGDDDVECWGQFF